MPPIVLLSVSHTGTHFMQKMLDWLDVEYDQWHVSSVGGWSPGRTCSEIPEGIKISPLRDPLLVWISVIQRDGRTDWRRAVERGYRLRAEPLMGYPGNQAAWEKFFKHDVDAYVRIDGTREERSSDLLGITRLLDVGIPIDFDEYVCAWKSVASAGDDHELKRAYMERDLNKLAPLIEQVKSIVPEFKARGYTFWWDE